MVPQRLVAFIAPPGAGKDTQAEIFAQRFGFERFEMSKVIEENFAAASPGDKVIQEQKKIWISGGLLDSKLIIKWTLDAVRKLHAEGKSLVLSGPLRKVEEAEADMPVFEELYGRENIWIFHINVSLEVSVDRNRHRRICEENRHPVPNTPEYKDLKICPWDGSPLIHRKLDEPDIIRERYEAYEKETVPVLDFLREKGYKVIDINGEQKLEKVSDEIASYVKDNFKDVKRY
ncbi:MAG: adenylate kinase [Parcubacteria group bacterium Licking1014_17]|nr:MAG: adenylate kinase [Parcubacteria group bacterium Licking1014_17]